MTNHNTQSGHPALAVGLALLACVLLFSFGCSDAPDEKNKPNEPAQFLRSGIFPQQPDTPLSADLQSKVAAGVSLHWLPQNSDEGPPELLLVEMDPAQLEGVLVAKPKEGISALQAIKNEQLNVVVGSGFVTALHSLQPHGLLQVEGRTINPVQTHGYTRILGINDKGMGVVHKKDFQRQLFHSALQAGPGIIEEGQLDISERDLQRPKYFRSFVAVCQSRWIAGVSLTPHHLRTLGQQLLSYIQDQKWQCKDVVNLAGDREAVLVLRLADGSTAYHGDPHTHKVSLLGFKPKS